MAKSGPLGPFSFRLLFWTTWPGRFPKASHLPPRRPGTLEGSRSLHLHPPAGVDHCKVWKDAPLERPTHADTRTLGSSLKALNNRNPSYHPGHLLWCARPRLLPPLPLRNVPAPGRAYIRPGPRAHLLQHFVQRLGPRQAVGAQAARLAALRAQRAASARTSDLCNVPPANVVEN